MPISFALWSAPPIDSVIVYDIYYSSIGSATSRSTMSSFNTYNMSDNIVLFSLPYALLLCPQGPSPPTNKNSENLPQNRRQLYFLRTQRDVIVTQCRHCGLCWWALTSHIDTHLEGHKCYPFSCLNTRQNLPTFCGIIWDI